MASIKYKYDKNGQHFNADTATINTLQAYLLNCEQFDSLIVESSLIYIHYLKYKDGYGTKKSDCKIMTKFHGGNEICDAKVELSAKSAILFTYLQLIECERVKFSLDTFTSLYVPIATKIIEIENALLR